MAIRDNYVFHTMRVAIHAAGQGLVIKDNVVRDQNGMEAWVDPTGKKPVGNSATLENRVIDWSGWDVLVEGNDGEVFRHRLNGGSYYSVDGEGILIQECCGGTLVNGVVIRNNTVNSYIGLYKMQDIFDATITGNSATTSFGIYVQADTNGAEYAIYDTLIANNTVTGGNITAKGSRTGAELAVNNNADGDATPSELNLSDYATESGNAGFNTPTITASTAVNRPPSVALTTPLQGDTAAGIDLLLQAEAADLDGPIASVTFYNHGTEIGTDSSAPYKLTIPHLPPGDHMLLAKATDDLGKSMVSDPIYLRAFDPAPATEGLSNGWLQLSHTEPRNPTGIDYRWLVSPDMKSWNPADLVELFTKEGRATRRIYSRDATILPPGTPDSARFFVLDPVQETP